MSRQDKATTDKFARTLRELVKRPENKVCADCKRNDPRWASWNIGVFLCIRCSGIHRSMGTHISKVKSVDLDVWTPEQMENIQKWGNYLANLYWEAHLKQGHVPPEHKMDSFIRSKYETRRWALDGPPPSDPSVLDSSAPVASSHQQASAPAVVPASTTTRQTHTSSHSLSGRAQAAAPVTTRQPQAHQLLSSNYSNRPTAAAQPVPVAAAPAPVQQPPKAPENDLFSLDFHAPPVAATTAAPEVKKDVKQDILSLFSTTPSAPAGGFGGQQQYNHQAAYWGGAVPQQQQAMQQQYQQQQQQPTVPTSMAGTNGTGMWGASSGWGATPAMPAQPNVWGAAAPAAAFPPQQANLFDTNSVWGGSAPAPNPSQDLFGSMSATHTQPAAQPKNDDVFGDIWGGFK